ncbi:MAG TPA: TonB family protein [Terriglobales bacterium]|nr:TonB family protein [Terriglobales bacterium]
MGYQAVLFCPDEKLARVVGHVFSELDFTVETVHEPFAAVKKFMAHRYDAVVVDCENEPNATLLFKSARNSSFNQSSLAIALVEGQAGVAKAYRIGANLVLTKPINVEQAKGTLRVARGLLRKNADAASAATPAPISDGNPFQPASRSAETMAAAPSRPELPEFEAPLPAMIAVAPPAATPAMTTTMSMTASAEVKDQPVDVPMPAAQDEILTELTIASEPAVETSQQVIETEVVSNEVNKSEGAKNEAAEIARAHVAHPKPGFAFMSAQGSAAAPAPAKEVTAPPVIGKGKESAIVPFEAAYPSQTDASTYSSPGTSDAPSFAGLDEEDSGRSGSGKKILIIAVAVLALAALGWELAKFTSAFVPQHASTPQTSGQPAPAPVPKSSLAPAPAAGKPDQASSAIQAVTSKTAAATLPGKPSADASNVPVTRIALDSEPETKKPDSEPLRVKSSVAGTKKQAHADESAPQVPSPLAVSSADDNPLSGLMSASPNLPKPSLATLTISQGVSQGLLIKRVQPKYPPAALATHTQGAVQIDAIINKEGNVTNLKVLSGDPVLAKAAVDAVRQWRYKPYYLDGEPVEIETQITVNFKAN